MSNPNHHNFKHGHRSGAYNSWKSMKARCDNPNATDYKSYGGRGISYDDSWKHFMGFLADMGERPPGTSLDRLDVNGNYCKSNCRWANPVEQANNTTYNVRYEFNGESLTLPEWSRRVGIKTDALWRRLNTRKWSVEKTLTTPLRGKR